MVKHNKLKNSGLLFELLVRQMTTDTLNNRSSEAANLIKKYFYNTDLLKEYKLYNTIATTRNLSEVKADILINSCLEAYKKMNKQNLRKQKYDLIAEINSKYNESDFFKAKVDNYKILASVYLLLEMHQADSIDEKVYSDCRVTLLEHVSSKKAEVKDDTLQELSEMDSGTRSLVYTMATKKFNDKYAGLNEGQRNLITEYINNISTSDNLRQYCNKQIVELKEQMETIIKQETDEVRRVKLTEITKSLVELPDNKSVSDSDVNNIMYYFELIKEHQNINESNK
jgi:hypothetical protein